MRSQARLSFDGISATAQALAAGARQLQPFMLASAERQPYALAG